ncbi:hypothetical protein [Marimonas arenosa]|uniref:Uncharacterized protein n=1 Tax=Marimonas arenosa TaxID=1795305 RepID=A0AAE3WFV0_9RHOB|nr:hypothetical protein [Marimonas arenosa]MDQ2090932.1 hypothetical protein [Marimonas arenosa]
MQLLIHRFEPNRPHISSDTSNFKERETKRTEMRLFFWRAPARTISLLLASRCLGVSAVARLAPRCSVVAASVRGYLRIAADPRNPFFWKSSSFFAKSVFLSKTNSLRRQNFVSTEIGAIFQPRRSGL